MALIEYFVSSTTPSGGMQPNQNKALLEALSSNSAATGSESDKRVAEVEGRRLCQATALQHRIR
jgi:hypothetical protein